MIVENRTNITLSIEVQREIQDAGIMLEKALGRRIYKATLDLDKDNPNEVYGVKYMFDKRDLQREE